MAEVLVTAAQMRALDASAMNDYGVPGVDLMENAGAGIADHIVDYAEMLGLTKAAVFAGRGNNGGDGHVIARLLAGRGFDVRVFLFARAANVTGDAKVNLNRLADHPVGLTEIPDADAFAAVREADLTDRLFVDALLGTGLSKDVTGLYKTAIEFMNASDNPVVAVDIPSGLDADTGHPHGAAVLANMTVTCGLSKIGMESYPGRAWCGDIRVVDIGFPPELLENYDKIRYSKLTSGDVAAILPELSPDAHKGDFGHLLVIAGAAGTTGAAAMTALGALRVGAGLVTAAVPASVQATVAGLVMEAMTLPLPDGGAGHCGEAAFAALDDILARATAIAVGPGIGTAEATVEFIYRLIAATDLPTVIDADGLNALARADVAEVLGKRTADTVLTPHPGEMARLTNMSTQDIQDARVAVAEKFAGAWNATVVLKGARSVIAVPQGHVAINPTGNPGMASAGSGDVLTGVIGGLLAQRLPGAEAAWAGTFIHGAAGDLAADAVGSPRGLIARDLIDAIPDALGAIDIGEPFGH